MGTVALRTHLAPAALATHWHRWLPVSHLGCVPGVGPQLAGPYHTHPLLIFISFLPIQYIPKKKSWGACFVRGKEVAR